MLRQNKHCYDVHIFVDNKLVEAKNVPKRFVREIKSTSTVTTLQQRKRKRCSSYGWSPRESELLNQAKAARVKALLAGAPASQPRAFVRNYLKMRGVEKRFVLPHTNNLFLSSSTHSTHSTHSTSLRQIVKETVKDKEVKKYNCNNSRSSKPSPNQARLDPGV